MRCCRYRHSGCVDRARLTVGAAFVVLVCALVGPLVWWPAPQLRWPAILLCVALLPRLAWRVFKWCRLRHEHLRELVFATTFGVFNATSAASLSPETVTTLPSLDLVGVASRLAAGAAVGALMTRAMPSSGLYWRLEPFCEQCTTWTRRRVVGVQAGVSRQKLIDVLKTGEDTDLGRLPFDPESAHVWLRFTVDSCPQCADFHVLTLDTAAGTAEQVARSFQTDEVIFDGVVISTAALRLIKKRTSPAESVR